MKQKWMLGAVLGAVTLGSLSSSARADTVYISSSSCGLLTCPVYATGSKQPTICYCGSQSFALVLDPAAPSLSVLRGRYNTFAVSQSSAQGGPGTLYIFTSDVAFSRALSAGFTLNTYSVAGRGGQMVLNFP